MLSPSNQYRLARVEGLLARAVLGLVPSAPLEPCLHELGYVPLAVRAIRSACRVYLRGSSLQDESLLCRVMLGPAKGLTNRTQDGTERPGWKLTAYQHLSDFAELRTLAQHLLDDIVTQPAMPNFYFVEETQLGRKLDGKVRRQHFLEYVASLVPPTYSVWMDGSFDREANLAGAAAMICDEKSRTLHSVPCHAVSSTFSESRALCLGLSQLPWPVHGVVHLYTDSRSLFLKLRERRLPVDADL
eukprot:2905882-Amphidinium_carterae.1